VRRLAKIGIGQRTIAAELGISRDTVRYHLGRPNSPMHKAKKRAARQRREAAARRQKIEEAARRRGGKIATAYGLLRKTALELQAAADSTTTAHERLALNDALDNLYKAEDAIGRAFKPSLRQRRLLPLG